VFAAFGRTSAQPTPRRHARRDVLVEGEDVQHGALVEPQSQLPSRSWRTKRPRLLARVLGRCTASEAGIWAHKRRMADAEGVISELKLRHGLDRARCRRGTPLFQHPTPARLHRDQPQAAGQARPRRGQRSLRRAEQRSGDHAGRLDTTARPSLGLAAPPHRHHHLDSRAMPQTETINSRFRTGP
jgi:hypothetical protein